MTNEELDAARAKEAVCRVSAVGRYTDGITYAQTAARTAARLTREGWEPVDPLVLEAQRICLEVWRYAPSTAWQTDWALGTTYRAALAALRRGIEIGKGEK